MSTLIQDLRFSLRQLAAKPGFTATAIISLALGIGATTAVFSVIYAVLIHPYPFRDAAGILRLTIATKTNPVEEIRLSPPQIQQLRQLSIVESVLAMDYRAMTITGQELPENVHTLGLISTGFDDLGVPPAMGRGLIPSDSIDGKDPQPVVLVSHQFWREHLNSDPQAVGKTLQLDHQPYTIIGIAAPRFRWYSADVYRPLKMDADPNHQCIIDFRLRPGVSMSAANAALQPLLEQFAKATPKRFPEGFKVQVEDLNAWVRRNMASTLYLLLGAVSLLLLIACGNVSILLMAQGTARQHEFAVRAAVGASASRMIRQLLTESLLLAALGVILGAFTSYWILAGMKAVLPKYAFAPEVVIAINLPVLAFSMAIAGGSVLLFGLWPALQLSQAQLGQTIVSNSRRSAGNVQGRKTHRALILLQVALTLVLLAAAGAALKSFQKLVTSPLGYDPHGVMSVGIPLRENSRTTWAARSVYFEQLRAQAAATPGVVSAAISTNATPPHSGFETPFQILGKPTSTPEQQQAGLNLIGPEYFATLRIPLLAGRIWSAVENRNGQHIAIVNRTLAERFFPHTSAIGQSLQVPRLEEDDPGSVSPEKIGSAWLQIIGIVEDSKNNGLSRPVRPAIFVPFTLHMWPGTQILVRTTAPPLTLLHAIRLQLTKVDADQQSTRVTGDLETWIEEEPEWQQERLIAWLFSMFSGLALALAVVGLYSVVSYSVAQRGDEFGIRMALGAQRTDITRIVVMSTLKTVGLGMILGVLLSLGLSAFLSQWAKGDTRDPLVLLAGVCLLGGAAALASAIPAWRASSVDPMRALAAK